ncbi:Alpha crystallin/Hsp20 domain [Arabidopsis thaliana x Arabidopsis arenosa]|uniref:Alpha crystallin/Hsp20 domain n=1 Tax=Arabidopsis thaliana x Arabidopsis arenosa TaxID=1240361 RepID=A0A8T1Y8S5_9BRAS|nr:Alpha crystallin/Hsp20 domain [Arabidopsis thaliana x Arabidopsis arenosa]
MAMAVPLSTPPQSPAEGFYAINNQFLTSGPKGFTEFKMLVNEDMFVRMDLPGVPEEGVRVFLDRSKKAVIVYAEAPKIDPHRSSCIAFLGGPGFREGISIFNRSTFSRNFQYLKPHPMAFPLTTMAYESKQLPDGKLYVRVDMPGVPSDNFTVSVTNGRVKVTGEAPAVGHDSSGRFYSGDVAMLSTPVDIPSHRIETIAKNGVIGLLIPPFC